MVRARAAETELAVGVAAPRQDGAGRRHRVVRAAPGGDRLDVPAGPGTAFGRRSLMLSWRSKPCVPLPSCPYSSLPQAITVPLLHQRHRVLVGRRDRPDPLEVSDDEVADGVFFFHHDVPGALFPAWFFLAVPQLPVAVPTPRDDRPVREQGEVEGAGPCEFDDVRQPFDGDRAELVPVLVEVAELAEVVFAEGHRRPGRAQTSGRRRRALVRLRLPFAILPASVDRPPGDPFARRGFAHRRQAGHLEGRFEARRTLDRVRCDGIRNRDGSGDENRPGE